MKLTVKRVFAMLLSLVMLLSLFPLTGIIAYADGGYQVGDILELGSYPQSRVTDASVLAQLNALEKNWVSYGYYSGNYYTGVGYDGQMTAKDYMKYADLTLNGVGYRAVTFTAYRPMYTGRDNSSISPQIGYQNTNGYYTNQVYYFKYEPLQWRLLDTQTGLSVCETIIDSQAYQNYILHSGNYYYGNSSKTFYANNYEMSSIRTWLNTTFYNTAFPQSWQKNRISHGEGFTADTYSGYTWSAGPTLTDSVFFLSLAEVKNSTYFPVDSLRQVNGTDYAKCQGLWVYSGYGRSEWWLRTAETPSSYTHISYVVNKAGGYLDRYTVSSTVCGVRPAVFMTLISGLEAQYLAHYNVTFLDSNGNEIETQSVVGGRAAVAPTAPAVAGKVHIGWNADFSRVTKNMTVTALYDDAYKTVTFLDADGSVIEMQSVPRGGDATAPTMSDSSNGVFIGWDRDFSNVTEDITVTAMYVPLSGYCGEHSTYSFDKTTGTLTLAGNEEFGYYYEIPWMYFSEQITHVVLSEGMTSLPPYAIECCGNMQTVVIPSTLISIGDLNFFGSQSLTDVYYAGTPAAWANVFIGEDNTYLSLATMHYGAFTVTFLGENGTVLSTQTVPAGTAATAPVAPEVAGKVFVGWDVDFSNVTTDLTVTAQYLTTSGTCGDNTTYNFDPDTGNMTISGTGDMDDYDNPTECPGIDYGDYIGLNDGNSVIENNVAEYAPWYDFRDLIETVTITNNVTSIGSCAFFDCANLESVSIPASVTSIGTKAFEYCTSLQYICSDTNDCYAKTYADANNIEFRLCNGHGLTVKELRADGKYYIDGVAVPAYYGLVEYEGDYYYIKDNARIVQSKTVYVNNTNGLTFPNGDPIPSGNYEFDADGKMMIKQGIQPDGKYYINGLAVPAYYGLVEWEGDFYYIKDNGLIVRNRTCYINTTHDLTLPNGNPIQNKYYEFDGDGKMIIKQGIWSDGKYYIDGVAVPSYYGLVLWEGDFYYIKDNAQVVRSKTCQVNTLNGLTFPNGDPIKQGGYYEFDADGKMIVKQGIWSDGKYYINGVAVGSYYGLVLWEGNYYYIKDNAQIVRSTNCYVNTTNDLTFPNGDPVPRGYYDFDADGKLVIKQGIQPDGKYYINGVPVPSYYGLVLWEGDYYYIRDNAQIVRNNSIRLNNTNGLTFPDGTAIPKATFAFDADGKMIY